MAKPAPKQSLAQRAKADPALLRRILANPGLRSKLPASMLPAKLAAQRKTNIRLKQPIVPGSAMTEGDLARNAKAAINVQYGPVDQAQQTALAQEQNRQRDVGGFYDAYLRQIAQHSQNVQAIGQQALAAGQATQGAVTGLAQADLTGLQNPAAVSAQARGATAGDLSQMASNAAAVRQALVGSFVNQQTGVNAANNTYADSQANVVAPGQKLGAVATEQGRVRQAQDAITATAQQKGAADVKYRSDVRADEAKNVLAQQIAGVNATAKKASTKVAQERVTETTRHNKAQEEASQKRADAQAVKDAAKVNQYGVRADQWAKWSTPHRQRVIDAKKGGKPKTTPAGQKPTWVTPAQSGEALTQVQKLKDFVSKAMKGEPFIPGHGKQKPLDRASAEAKVRAAAPSLKNPVLLTAAADAVQLHYLPAATVKALIAAGYKPSEVASALGVSTSGQIKSSSRTSADGRGN